MTTESQPPQSVEKPPPGAFARVLNGPPGNLVSLSKRYAQSEGDPSFCGHCSAPYIHDRKTGKQIGVYIDDTTPHRRMWITTALAHHPPPQIVFVGIASPAEHSATLDSPDIGVPDVPAPALIRLQEWIPWGMGYAWQNYGRVPACGPGNGYILQMRWFGFYGHQSPNLLCKATMLRQAHAHRPRFIFTI